MMRSHGRRQDVLNGSSSLVLNAVHHSYGSLVRLSDFYSASPLEARPLTGLHVKWLKQLDLCRDVSFALKTDTFYTP